MRICDHGGWTDTWFGGPGRVVNVAVAPGVDVALRAVAGRSAVHLDVGGDRYAITPGSARAARHELVEAAIDTYPPPDDRGIEVRVASAVPAGCGAGTSAAVAVALIGGLAAARAEALSRRDVASAAHRLEVEVLGAESGVQDQLSAALGGINFIEIDPYPEVCVEALPAWDALGSHLTLMFLGRAHVSSDVHRDVIDGLGGAASTALAQLRAAALAARDAVVAQDLHAFGAAMIANPDGQRRLHASLVGADAHRVIGLARRLGAIGWKVNGAGGDGGSVTLLSATPAARTALERAIVGLDPRYRPLPIRPSAAGLEVRGSL